ncbi:MAG: hypothetical protein IKQ00_08805 [Butyrivibrio sp.]|nr:hypothetical protein [Butyrivibrio sp.]
MKQTAQIGMAPSRIPTLSKDAWTSEGMVNSSAVPIELEAVIFEITLWTMVTKSTIKVRPLSINALAITKRTKTFTAVSGLLSSAKLPQVLTTPTVKKRTRRAVPIAPRTPFMVVIMLQMPPPLKFCGEVVRMDHILSSMFPRYSSPW